MDKKFLVTLSYDGSKFYGWGKQPNLRTIQGEVEKNLSSLYGKKIKIVASGRTDRYVHAINQVFSIEQKNDSVISKKQIRKTLSKIDDIKIKNIREIDFLISPRFDNKNKTYKYILYTNRNKAKSSNKDYEYQYFRDIDMKVLREDAKYFVGEKNFASFTGKQTYQNYVRKINFIKIKKKSNKVIFLVNGDGFMRYMVRNIVGSLLAKNRNKYSKEEFEDLFTNPVKGKSHFKAPGSGLYLKKVYYKKIKK